MNIMPLMAVMVLLVVAKTSERGSTIRSLESNSARADLFFFPLSPRPSFEERDDIWADVVGGLTGFDDVDVDHFFPNLEASLKEIETIDTSLEGFGRHNANDPADMGVVDQHLTAVDATTTFPDDHPELDGSLDDFDEFLWANAGVLVDLTNAGSSSSIIINSSNNNHHSNINHIDNIENDDNILGTSSNSSNSSSSSSRSININMDGVGGLEPILAPTSFDPPHLLHPGHEPPALYPAVVDFNLMAQIVNHDNDADRFFGQATLVEGGSDLDLDLDLP